MRILEYLAYRCCMCPNYTRSPESNQCPAGTPCRFVKTYCDERGWAYRVMGGLGESNFKARYNKEPDRDVGWKCVAKLPWRKSFDEAQGDLNELAKRKGWREVN